MKLKIIFILFLSCMVFNTGVKAQSKFSIGLRLGSGYLDATAHHYWEEEEGGTSDHSFTHTFSTVGGLSCEYVFDDTRLLRLQLLYSSAKYYSTDYYGTIYDTIFLNTLIIPEIDFGLKARFKQSNLFLICFAGLALANIDIKQKSEYYTAFATISGLNIMLNAGLGLQICFSESIFLEMEGSFLTGLWMGEKKMYSGTDFTLNGPQFMLGLYITL